MLQLPVAQQRLVVEEQLTRAALVEHPHAAQPACGLQLARFGRSEPAPGAALLVVHVEHCWPLGILRAKFEFRLAYAHCILRDVMLVQREKGDRAEERTRVEGLPTESHLCRHQGGRGNDERHSGRDKALSDGVAARLARVFLSPDPARSREGHQDLGEGRESGQSDQERDGRTGRARDVP
eukprot:383122-Pleurochrysis_carterae.AAC.1